MTVSHSNIFFLKVNQPHYKQLKILTIFLTLLFGFYFVRNLQLFTSDLIEMGHFILKNLITLIEGKE